MNRIFLTIGKSSEREMEGSIIPINRMTFLQISGIFEKEDPFGFEFAKSGSLGVRKILRKIEHSLIDRGISSKMKTKYQIRSN